VIGKVVQREMRAARTASAGENPLEIHRALDATDRHREPGGWRRCISATGIAVAGCVA